MSNTKPRPGTVLRRAIRVALRQVRVSLPGQILSFDAVTCQADVQPLIMEAQPQADGTSIVDQLPVSVHCPVLFVGGGGSRLTFPVKAGDMCLLLFASSAIDRWKALGGIVDPQDDRHQHLTDGIAIVGLSDFAHAAPANTSATVLEGDDVRAGDAGSAAALAFNADLKLLIDTIKGATSGDAIAGAVSSAFSSDPAGTQNFKAS